jgi:Domain of unknown function DUF29
LGRADRRALASHIAFVIEHLLKLQAAPASASTCGWRDTILRARGKIEQLLSESPSLRREIAEMISKRLPEVRTLVRASLQDYGEQPQIDIDQVTDTEDQVLGDWLPASA